MRRIEANETNDNSNDNDNDNDNGISHRGTESTEKNGEPASSRIHESTNSRTNGFNEVL